MWMTSTLITVTNALHGLIIDTVRVSGVTRYVDDIYIDYCHQRQTQIDYRHSESIRSHTLCG